MPPSASRNRQPRPTHHETYHVESTRTLGLDGRPHIEGGGRNLTVTLADFANIGELIAGVGVVVLIGMPACIAPTMRALRIMPTEALKGGV